MSINIEQPLVALVVLVEKSNEDLCEDSAFQVFCDRLTAIFSLEDCPSEYRSHLDAIKEQDYEKEAEMRAKNEILGSTFHFEKPEKVILQRKLFYQKVIKIEKCKTLIDNFLTMIKAKEIEVINGIWINKNENTVRYRNVDRGFNVGDFPWFVIRKCVENEEEKGTTDLKEVMRDYQRTEAEVYKEFSRMNEKWRKKFNVKIIYVEKGLIRLEPKPI